MSAINPQPFKHRSIAQRLIVRTLLTAREADHEVYGLAIHRATGLASGTVHPILHKLSDAGWVTSRIEEQPRTRQRTYYRLTDAGADAAEQWLTNPAARRKDGDPTT